MQAQCGPKDSRGTVCLNKLVRMKYFKKRMAFYPNSTATFNPSLDLLVRCGDIHPMPGPQNTTNKPHSKLSLMLLNARSLVNKLIDFQASIYSKSVDIIIVSETWLTSAILNHEILPSCYSVYRRDREDRRGGGVLIAIKSDIYSVRRTDLETNCELVVVEVNPSKGNKFLVCGFYRPPSTKREYLLELQNFLAKFNAERDPTPLYLCGDFNFPDINWDFQVAPGADNLSNMFCDIINDSLLTQMNHAPTRITDNTRNILDLVFTNHPERICGLMTFDCQLASDHLGVQFDIKTLTKRERVPRYVYDFKKADFEGLRRSISVTQLDIGYDENDIDQSWESWRDLFLNAVESFIPKIRLKDAKSPKWIDSEIIKLSKKKDRLWRRAKQSNSPTLWESYRILRKQIKTATKRKYHDFLMNIQSDLKDNPKKFWSFYGAKTKSSRIPKVVCFGNQKASTPVAKANLFNRFFASVFQKSNLHMATNTHTATDNELHLIQASVEEVTKSLRAIDPSKACGPDQIPGRLLKECASEIAPSLTRLINLSLRVGRVPQEWKRANIVPVLKKGNKEDVKNYRPISLLSLISKIAERCVFDRFFEFIASNIYPLQHGFVRGRSTITQLLDTVNQITKSIDQGVQTDVAFLDFSKAFDSVSHPHLVSKLDQCGIKGPLLQWFFSYLDNRVQRVVIDGKSSEWLPVTSGVPQGSLLGPALFVLFINDMPCSVSEDSTMALFADDAKCYRTIRSVNDCAQLQTDIDNLVEWSDAWKMAFNTDKCSLCTVKGSAFQ